RCGGVVPRRRDVASALPDEPPLGPGRRRNRAAPARPPARLHGERRRLGAAVAAGPAGLRRARSALPPWPRPAGRAPLPAALPLGGCALLLRAAPRRPPGRPP